MSDTVERTSSSQTSHAGQRPAAAASSYEPRPALGPLVALIEERVPVERRETMVAFAKAYLRRLADDEITTAPPEELYGLVRCTFDFVDGRRLQPWVVRVFNPDIATDGFTSPGTVLETSVDDSPFLVDSVTAELTARNLVVRRILHPVIGTSRDGEGRLERISSARDASHRESVMHFELDRRLSDTTRADLEERLETILRDVRLVVRDFEPMQDRAHNMLEMARHAAVRYSPQEVGEAVDFLDWLLQLNFVFLGFREYELVDSPDGRAIRAVPGSGLGILSDVSRSAFADTTLLDSLDPGLRRRIEDGDLLVFSKTNAYSTVHRRARMDYIGVRRVNADGEIVGEARMIGLFTSKAYMEPAAKTPLLHHKLEQVLTAEDLIPGSHDYKSATTLFESFPKDELFQASAGELRRLISGLLQLERHGGIRVLVRRDLYGRSISIVVALPRDRFNADLRKSLQRLFMERFRGSTIDYHLSLGETENARIFFTVHVDPGVQIPEVPYEELEQEVERLARTWDDDLRDALIVRVDADRGSALADRYAPRFPDYYKSNRDWELIVDDVLKLDELEQRDEGFVVGLGNEATGERLTRVKLYKTGGKVDLSAFMPILEALGLRVVEEVPTGLLGDGKVYIHDFGVLDSRGAVLDLEHSSTRVEETIVAVWRGLAESDSLNRLIVAGGLTWEQVGILRAYRKYRQRISTRFTAEYRNDALAENPVIASKLIAYFETRFDPDRASTEEEMEATRKDILQDLRRVASLDQDQILRHMLGTIQASVRTNAYRPVRESLSFKLRSGSVAEMPKPFPLFEVFVYSAEMEAIHLRGGMVSRGGIRWSDRKEDYRTEVLGLMKAQMVKNAIIVPDGSKGGFILKRNPLTPDLLKAEVIKQYVTFMRGLLDITDNLDQGNVVHPERVRVLDADDTYLVVAADKGTATFSDTANSVAAEYGYWLGDAFASGGSAGFDHKALGITARGAWESVKRHFRELGIDIMSTPFTVVGIGDMSGDVFGNGMLLSPFVKLVAAFDHRHVFVDPDPDPTGGFEERRRLFDMPGSSWDDYDRTKMSPAGDIFDRKAKSVTPSPQVRAAVGIPDDAPEDMTPNDLIKAILKAPVDLLWNGGIGTYVKSTRESNGDVGDRANDTVRINGNDVRARVVGEGGNLGFTQLGRIEYALGGGRINTDFIDNSAGVDTSDHEVNWKVLLGLAMSGGELTLQERNELLQSCAPDVVEHVLYDNYLQAQILSQELDFSVERNDAYEDLMQQLVAEGELEREVEFLPSSEEMLERRANGQGMVRPELAVLLAYAKRSIATELIESDLPDSEYLEQNDLRRYFPAAIVDRFGHLIPEHPLKRELIATIVANDVVNSAGITFVSRMVTETGSHPADVVRAYRIARDVTGAVERWESIEALDGVIDPRVQGELMRGVDYLVETASRWYLVQTHGERLSEAIDDQRASFAELSSLIWQIGPEPWREEHELDVRRLVAEGVLQEIARRHAFQGELVHGPDIIAVAHATGWEVMQVARAFFIVGERVGLDWLEHRLESLPVGTHWQRWAAQSMEDDLFLVRRQLVEKMVAEAPAREVDEAVEAFFARRAESEERLQRFIRNLSVEGITDLAQFTVALRQVRTLLG
ncbi:MAG: NAD-glutamate dehydrogenase [Actinomycetota bacterium]